MRKAFLLLSLTAICGYAQQVDTTTPYFWVEKEVVDTVKAEEMASQIKAERRAKIKSSNDSISTKIRILSAYKDNKQKKIQSEEDAIILKIVAEEYHTEIESCISYNLNLQRLRTGRTPSTNSDREMQKVLSKLSKGKIDDYYSLSFDRIIKKMQGRVEDETKYDNTYFASLISPLPMKTIKVKQENPDYVDANFHWLDKFETTRLTLKSTSYPIKDEYYASEQFPQFKFRKDKYMSHRWLVYDQSDNLVAATLPTEYDFNFHGVDWIMLNACARYDYEHNAYNISQESAAVKKYIEYTLREGRSVKSQLASAELAQSALDGVLGGLKRERLHGRITQEQYNRQYKNYQDETAKNQKLIADLRKQLPSKDVIERADNYIKQIDKDNEPLLSRGYNERLEVKRINGLEVMLTFHKGLKMKQTGFYDPKENHVDWKYTVLEK